MSKFFRLPFAISGTKVTVPDASQVDGTVSYTDGYGPDYSLNASSNPSALNIERTKFNELLYDITDAIRQYQVNGVPDFITTSDNGGVAFPYGINAITRYNPGSGYLIYRSLNTANTALPSDSAHWAVVNNLTDGDKGDIVVSSNGTVFTIDTGVVVAGNLASNAVTTIKILDANVTTAKLADAAVTTVKIADANVTTAKILDANVTTAKLANNSITFPKLQIGAMPQGYQNKLRNPGMNIAQRSVSGTITSGNSAYTLDGWIVKATGGTVTWGQSGNVQLPDTGQMINCLSLAGNASVTKVEVYQRIEAADSAILANQLVTSQILIDNFTGATIIPQLSTSTPTVVDNWASSTADLALTTLQSILNTTINPGAYTFVVSGNALLGYEIRFTFNISGGFSGLYLTAADTRRTPGLTVGLNNAPPLPEIRNLGLEWPLNLRYFRKSFPYATAPAANTSIRTGSVTSYSNGTGSNAAVMGKIDFGVPMRIIPTVTTYNPNANNSSWRNQSAASDLAATIATGASGVTEYGFLVVNNATAITQNYYEIHWSASAEL